MKISPKRYLQTFGICVVLLAIVRAVCPSVAGEQDGRTAQKADTVMADRDTIQPALTPETVKPQPLASAESKKKEANEDKEVAQNTYTDKNLSAADLSGEKDVPPAYTASWKGKRSTSRFFNPDGTLAKHRIYSVPHFGNAFPDQNDMQLTAAQKYGVKPVADRAEAERRKKELVYIGSNPYFHVDRLRNSIPYLVPRASVLLQDIGRNFFDSLQVKGIPLHKIIVTSVLRSKADVEKLRNRNSNATQNSCHLYGTTFDVCYNRYKTVQDPDGPARRQVRNDTLKWVLSEVLNDIRLQKRCYVKYEVKQGCFHITVN